MVAICPHAIIGALLQNLSLFHELFHSTLSGKGPFSLEGWISGIVE